METRWILRTAEPEAAARVARRNGLHAAVGQLLVSRGHRDPERSAAHLEASLMSLRDPSEMPGAALAATRIRRALENKEVVLVHGDYDVDGLSGTALLMRLLQLVGVRARPYIPNRLTDGYSFGPHSIAKAQAEGAKLVVSVDNGTSAHDTIRDLLAVGVETVVTDHHEPPRGPLPPAVALVNPKLEGSTYPFRELCGAGVAFKLAWAVCQEISGARKVREDLRLFLADAMSYVAIATVCDVVPLVDENRVLARRGLVALETTKHVGLRALLSAAGLEGVSLNAEDVGFKLGPRLNAAGRLGSASSALELLLCNDPWRAKSLADELEKKNVERKRIEAVLVAEALVEAERFADPERYPVLVLAREGWHPGVVGIVAARLVDRFRRPALVIGLDGGKGRGSARSVDDFDVLEAMRGGAEHMERFGGHAQAAGCEVRAESIDALRDAVCAKANAMLAGRARANAELLVDYDLPLADMSVELMRQLDRLEPFGEKNEKPLFVSRDLRLAEPARTMGASGAHLSMLLRSGERVLRAVAFGQGKRVAELRLGEPVHVAYSPRWNTFRGETNLELVLEDFRTGPSPEIGAAR
ncbi:MAG: single-stranded-DNA-specific exonuclease RecJ [Planctomycetes bacterium]|nr:single-stranded-DNA-specific exonuclease RecJ [Planctomycetota bacterium]